VRRIETFFIDGPGGRIECMLKTPAPGPEPRAAAIVCHPHPLFGGTMHNKVVHAAAEALVEAGIPALRFNFRGAGRSAGRHDAGRGERDDLRRLLDHLRNRFPGRPLVLAGYSFGAWVALGVGCDDPRAAALIGIGVPLTMADFRFLAGCRKPLTLVQGGADPFAPPDLLLAFAASLPGGARVTIVKDAGHDFAGHLDDLARRVADGIPEDLRAAPESAIV
jgi:hypothetical protein